MVSSKILHPRKIEENKRESRNTGFKADIADHFQVHLQLLFHHKFERAL